MHDPAIAYRDVSVLAGGRAILDGISLAIDRHERVVYLGRSGAGKTTALKVVNGLVAATRGEVTVDGIALGRHDLVALRRRIGYVMQQPALFPHRTVHDNIATVPRLLGWPEARTRDRAEELLRILELDPARFGERFPRGLSGGEQQRVAIARALIAEPAILLCDEPFSALDPLLRAELQSLLIAAARTTTLVFVTHDVREAMHIGQRIIVFDAGRIVAETTPATLAAHDHPLVRRFAASVS
ncbi:MAG TPA: ATP-binding cassette domain-containing protein [Thermoanaerobaculia bacterium]|nr:ATP-binding cassette domain-containing protein [Thermoanaerobaculia bacterium]